jgi:hypothetical protein
MRVAWNTLPKDETLFCRVRVNGLPNDSCDETNILAVGRVTYHHRSRRIVTFFLPKLYNQGLPKQGQG